MFWYVQNHNKSSANNILFWFSSFYLFQLLIFQSHKLHWSKDFWNDQGKHSGEFFSFMPIFQCFWSVYHIHINRNHKTLVYFLLVLYIFLIDIIHSKKTAYFRNKRYKKGKRKASKCRYCLVNFLTALN